MARDQEINGKAAFLGPGLFAVLGQVVGFGSAVLIIAPDGGAITSLYQP